MKTPFGEEVKKLEVAAINLEMEIHRVMDRFCVSGTDRQKRFEVAHIKSIALTQTLSVLEKEVR